jgi:hypothetical protein
MTNDTWIRYGAATGVGAVVLYVIGALIMPRPPAFDAPTSEVVAYFADDQTRIQLALAFYAAAALLFLWFVGTLTGVTRVAEGGAGRLSRIAFGAAVASVTLFVVAMTTVAAATARADEGILSDEVIHALSDASALSFAAGAFVFAGLFAALGLAIVRSGALPGWLGGLAGVTAVTIVLWIGGLFTTTGAFNPATGLFGYWVGLVAFLAWTAIASVVLVGAVGRGEGEAAPTPGPTGAPGPGSTP